MHCEYSMWSWAFTVHWCCSDLPIFLTFQKKINGLLIEGDPGLIKILDKNPPFNILPNLQVHIAIPNQIKNLLIINFHIGASNRVRLPLTLLKQILKQPRQDAPTVSISIPAQISHTSQNGISLATPCLTIGENTTIVALEFS